MQIGVVLALFSALLFGASTPLAKLLLGAVEPQVLAGLLYLGAGIGLSLIYFSRGILRLPAAEAALRRADIPWLAAVIVSGGVLGPLLLMLGLSRTDAGSAALLLNVEGLATMSIAWLAFREHTDRRLLLGAFAILAGTVVLTWRGGAALNAGTVLIVAACCCWGVDNNLTRKLSSADPVRIVMLKGLVAGAINLALGLLLGAGLPGSGILLGAGLLGFFGYGVSLALFVLALRHLGAARTGAYFSLAPFIGAILAVLLLHAPLTLQLGLAGGLMAVGLWLHLSEHHEHEHAHAGLEHAHRHVHDRHHEHRHARDDPDGEPHSHWHAHSPMVHRHPHYPDLHHRHGHGVKVA
jgi:drug/metabolite transporter (DMT)-like permease